MSNATALNFGYPSSLIAETEHWLVLIRPKQPTFGSLALVCKEEAHAFADLSPAAFADLRVAIQGIEALLAKVVSYAKINYLMLMMVDPDVHFHVVPRYEGVREHEGLTFRDAGWPGAPALGEAVELSPAMLTTLAAAWRAAWAPA